ncbi:putative receptor-like protein kinase [Zostera marina]|uniref:Putative receptor-like protein kinase n=1 Tax=Zostera marina TaxID=29655 RepID=A0A0K9PHQ9_ZOSMR|nr:putative receptor-like protein kinase [Zostera marina]
MDDTTKLVCFFILIPIVVGVTTSNGEPVFIDCGSTTTNTAADGRVWVGDGESNKKIINFALSSPGFIAVPKVDFGEESKTYKTARIFTTASNYTFHVLPGNYYLRLHFRPFAFESVSVKHVNSASFDVFSNHLKLLTDYNISDDILRQNSLISSSGGGSSNLTANVSSLVKEYFVNISSSELFISFVPTQGSFAFVNAIEIVPVLNPLFFESASAAGGTARRLDLVDRGLETMFRLTVGGSEIDPALDRDLWRKWESDNIYMRMTNAGRIISNTSNISYSSYSDYSSSSSPAPLLLYSQARIMSNTDVVDKKINMSWNFKVDPKFEYLVRLHFCELLYEGVGQRIFRIYLNFRIAAENFDVFERAGGKNKAYHKDFVDVIRPDQSGILWLQLGPDSLSSASGTDALLNGVEIFKLSQKGTLAHVSEKFGGMGEDSGGNVSKSRNTWVGILAGFVSVFTFSCFVIFCFCCRKKKDKEKTAMGLKGGGGEPSGWHPLVLHGMLESTNNAVAAKSGVTTDRKSCLGCRNFTIPEIKSATNNFSESLLIGTGGFGKVYKGTIDDGVLVAIKRAHTKSSLVEFETEIEMLSKLRHPHLVSMIGYCDEQNEMIMVYEFMGNGTLQSLLFGIGTDTGPSSSLSVSLTWKQRLEACIGAARGLDYLHSTDRGIIHRDVKTTNILLDDNLVAKMADFGLSKTGPEFDRTHVSTAVRGSFGYLDPEYFRRQQLTEKSDVYSFGVVLFEVICARPVINPTLPKDQINLAEWALRWQRQRSLETIVDPRLVGDYSTVSLLKFGEIAEKCLADEGKNRPSMGEVVSHLEHVLELHVAYLTSRVNIEEDIGGGGGEHYSVTFGSPRGR